MGFLRNLFNKPDGNEDKSDEIKTSPSLPAEEKTSPYEPTNIMPSFNTEGQTAKFDGVTRELQPEPENPYANGHPNIGYLSDVGMVRDNNEDAAFTFFSSATVADGIPDFGLFVIADGMGGHQMGERASGLAVKVVAKYIMEKIYLPLITDGDDGDRPPMAEILIAAVKNANEAVMKAIADGGTTLTIMVLLGDWGHFAHVGDSRAYLITKENAEQITRDHSLVQRLIELNQLSVEESREHPQRNVLYRAIGQNETIEVDTLSRRLPANSSILLCSDGLWDVVSNHQIREVIATAINPQVASEKLVALATTQGSTDNVTAIVLKMPNS
jgi:serine/threonine protein phosphatase PrpC